ncbi:hypothetical protein [Aliikangiella sp. IMCC44359]|uniref:hypothetical protein n=1 Tax=Aliikangiella sp. IMCC44359 TaxID=3459125 RepID=UPI00403AE62D
MNYILYFILLLTSAYFCIGLVFWPKLIAAHSYYSTTVYYAALAAPYVLLLTSIKGWHRAFVWRRMYEAQQKRPRLSRGEVTHHLQKPKPSFLELCCIILLGLSLCALWGRMA